MHMTKSSLWNYCSLHCWQVIWPTIFKHVDIDLVHKNWYCFTSGRNIQ